jgi:ABC-2 type transport system permease protein
VKTSTFVRYELVRNFRNRRFFVFTVGFPLVLYFLIATPNRHEHDLAGSGISAPLYFMVGLAALGTMNAVVGGGARIAFERVSGWTRQLRLTPLRPGAYFGTKVAAGYLSALLTIVALYAAGILLGVQLSAGRWLQMTGLLLLGLLPFAALGIMLGHLLGVEAVGPTIGGLSGLLGFLGGVWFPLGGGVMRDIAEALPSFWLVQASHVSLGGPGWSVTGWLVVAAWTVVLSVLAAYAYRRDTARA